MPDIFLKAEWKNLVMANYIVPPGLLKPYLPGGTELDFFEGKCYMSLVGFLFAHTRILGFKIPFHMNFEEVNLRFYVIRNDGTKVKRGVVFIREIVPKRMISWVANTFYNEHYSTTRMKHQIHFVEEMQTVNYSWKNGRRWNAILATASLIPISQIPGSRENFITEHYWGYSKSKNGTTEYAVEHPQWKIFPVTGYQVDCNFGAQYGNDFIILDQLDPDFVCWAEGSLIQVRNKKIFSL